MDIILASASPRRKELLEMLGVENLKICPADCQEVVPAGAAPAEAVLALATQKCEFVAQAHPNDVVIAADTVVAIDGKILGKPGTEARARQMLCRLSGREHYVYTGVAVKMGEELIAEYEQTAVNFRPMSDREIDAYIATGECMDKAGAYGIQGKGGYFISSIKGDYYNVVGLPICRLGMILSRLGVDLI